MPVAGGVAQAQFAIEPVGCAGGVALLEQRCQPRHVVGVHQPQPGVDVRRHFVRGVAELRGEAAAAGEPARGEVPLESGELRELQQMFDARPRLDRQPLGALDALGGALLGERAFLRQRGGARIVLAQAAAHAQRRDEEQQHDQRRQPGQWPRHHGQPARIDALHATPWLLSREYGQRMCPGQTSRGAFCAGIHRRWIPSRPSGNDECLSCGTGRPRPGILHSPGHRPNGNKLRRHPDCIP